MGNSIQQPNSDSYEHELTVDNLSSISHAIMQQSDKDVYYAANYEVKVAFKNKEPVGYLQIAPGFEVSVYEKPHPKYLHNMRKTFGWTWKNV